MKTPTEDQIDAACRTIERAVYVAERIHTCKFAEHLLIAFGDRLGELKEGPHIVCAAGRVTEPGELVRVYISLDDGIGFAIKLDLLTIGLRPFLETSGSDLILKKTSEGFKICRRDPS
jgi:hypothetical protein